MCVKLDVWNVSAKKSEKKFNLEKPQLLFASKVFEIFSNGHAVRGGVKKNGHKTLILVFNVIVQSLALL